MLHGELLDKYLPEYTFSEYHEIDINSSIETVYNTSTTIDFSKSRLIHLLFKIRGLPTRKMDLQGFVSDMGFTHLGENKPNEYLIGFWARTKIEPIPSHEAFIQNTISARIKAAWNFKLEKSGKNKIRLSTETRVLCTSFLTKISFGLYWLLIRFFSGEIRKIMLRMIKKAAEKTKKIV